MAQPTRKIDFVGGKVNETPAGSATITIIDAISDSITAAEASGAMKFNLAASATDVNLSMGNVATANVLVILTDGAVSLKFNGSLVPVLINKTAVLFATISGILASNPSSSEVRAITLYAATVSD